MAINQSRHQYHFLSDRSCQHHRIHTRTVVGRRICRAGVRPSRAAANCRTHADIARQYFNLFGQRHFDGHLAKPQPLFAACHRPYHV